jgi:hypothetical protein
MKLHILSSDSVFLLFVTSGIVCEDRQIVQNVSQGNMCQEMSKEVPQCIHLQDKVLCRDGYLTIHRKLFLFKSKLSASYILCILSFLYYCSSCLFLGTIFYYLSTASDRTHFVFVTKLSYLFVCWLVLHPG